MTPPLLLTDIALRFIVALACGAVLGWDRETNHKPAGFRTSILIVLGAASYTMVALSFVSGLEVESSDFRLDLMRLVQGVIGGIGFLGAGAIIQSGGSIRGMTTAATIWVMGAVGIAAGAGFYRLAIVTVVFSMIVLRGLGFVEKQTRLFPQGNDKGGGDGDDDDDENENR